MKILAVSLLRIGDLIMQERLLVSLSQKYPECRIDLLVNDVAASYAKTITLVNQVYTVPRRQLQAYLVESDRNPVQAFLKMKELGDQLNAQAYDLVIDFSHSLFAARMLDLIQAKQKMGMHFDNGSAQLAPNMWAEFINEDFAGMHKSPSHYIEALARSLELPAPKLLGNKAAATANPVIALQPISSDAKKDWFLPNWYSLAREILHGVPGMQIIALGGPADLPQLKAIFSALPQVRIEICNWLELKKLLLDVHLLISVDTSILHLASRQRVQSLGLFLGSANPSKTGPYLQGSRVMTTNIGCFPCRHGKACGQASHLCGEALSVAEVYTQVANMLGVSQSAVALNVASARAMPNKVKTYEVRQGILGEFSLRQIGGPKMARLAEIFEQMVWQIYLDGGHKEPAAPVGSAAHLFLNEMATELFAAGGMDWLQGRFEQCDSDLMFLDEVQEQVTCVGRKLTSWDAEGEQAFNTEVQQIAQRLSQFIGMTSGAERDAGDFFYQLRTALNCNFTGFAKMRRIRSAIDESRHLLTLENKFVKSLINELTERGPVYVAGFRKALENRTSTT